MDSKTKTPIRTENLIYPVTWGHKVVGDYQVGLTLKYQGPPTIDDVSKPVMFKPRYTVTLAFDENDGDRQHQLYDGDSWEVANEVYENVMNYSLAWWHVGGPLPTSIARCVHGYQMTFHAYGFHYANWQDYRFLGVIDTRTITK